jgi:hypothetical protein
MDTIVARSTDEGYRAWADAQSDCWYEDDATQLQLFEEDELATELCTTEGLPFWQALSQAEGMLPGLAAYAQDWDRHAWLGGNEASAAF